MKNHKTRQQLTTNRVFDFLERMRAEKKFRYGLLFDPSKTVPDYITDFLGEVTFVHYKRKTHEDSTTSWIKVIKFENCETLFRGDGYCISTPDGVQNSYEYCNFCPVVKHVEETWKELTF